MGILLSVGMKSDPDLSYFHSWDVVRFTNAVETFINGSTSFGWSINQEIYKNTLSLTDEVSKKTWPIWDKQDVNKLNALEIFCGIAILMRGTFEEKVIAIGNLFDFHGQKTLGMKSFFIGVPIIIQSVCYITNQEYPNDEIIQRTSKNAYKSILSINYFQRRIDIETKLIEWCYAAGEPYFIFSHFNTKNKIETMKIRQDTLMEWLDKSQYIKMNLAEDVEKECRKFGGLIIVSPRTFTNKDGSFKNGSVFSFDESLTDLAISKLIYQNPKKSKKLQNRHKESRRESRFTLKDVDSFFGNLDEALTVAIKTWREHRVDATTRVGGFFTVKEAFDNKTRFDAIDNDNSAEIELSEFILMFPDAFGGGIHATRIFKSMDKDKSGQVSFYELMSKVYPLAARKDKILVCSWTEHNYINQSKTLQLKSLFKAVNHYYKDQCKSENVVPYEPMFAILARCKQFFPFTIYAKTTAINRGPRYITLEKLVKVLFSHNEKFKRQIPQILQWLTPAKLTKKQYNDLRLLFGTFDSDGNGTIDESEFLHACYQFNLPNELINGAFQRYDLDHKNKITFETFQQFFCDVWNADHNKKTKQENHNSDDTDATSNDQESTSKSNDGSENYANFSDNLSEEFSDRRKSSIKPKRKSRSYSQLQIETIGI